MLKTFSKKLNESADQNTFEFTSIFKLQNIVKIEFISILAGGGLKSGGGLIPGGLIIRSIFCLQVDRPITGGEAYKWGGGLYSYFEKRCRKKCAHDNPGR